MRNDVHNVAYKYKKWIKAHSEDVYSLAVVEGNQLLSASYDGTVKLWNTTKGRFKHHIRTFKCGLPVTDAVAIGSSQIMAVCQYTNKIRVFDFETGEEAPLGFPIIELGFKPYFIALSPDSKSVFTSRPDVSVIQSFDVETKALITTYNQSADALAFLDDHKFVTSNCTNVFVWNVDRYQ